MKINLMLLLPFLGGLSLARAGKSFEFVPASNAEWKTATVPMVLTATDNRTRFKFEFNASDAANNL